jgi:peptidoglycan hydrolase CwlO-like protein
VQRWIRRKANDKVKLKRIILILSLLLSSFTVGLAQNSSAENLRSQLSDAQKKEDELQTRIRQIEEDIRPENIEKAFALNGSTRPEELREQRRRQLETERTNVRAQLDQLAQSRARLEAAIATAEAAAYRQSALPGSDNTTTAVNPDSLTVQPVMKPKPSQRRARRRTRHARRRG